MLLVLDNYDSFTYNLADALRAVNPDWRVVRNDDPTALACVLQARALVLSPGPGLPETSGVLLEAIRWADGRIPVLGICLGMQLLGVSSTEDGLTEGLGLVKNTVTKLIDSNEVSIKIPHVGFNRVQMPKESKLFDQISIDASFYFVHSYAMQILDDSSKYATTTYGHKFVAAIESGQIFGTQFHPEKSQKSGLKVLEGFLR